MDSELRKSLLKAPSTSASTALVRSLGSKLRSALIPSFFPTFFLHPALWLSTFKLWRTKSWTLVRLTLLSASNRVRFPLPWFLHEHRSCVQSGVYGEERERGR